VTVGFWHEYSRILQRNSLYTLRPNHNGDCYTIYNFPTLDLILNNCRHSKVRFFLVRTYTKNPSNSHSSVSRQLLLLRETLRVACFPVGVQVGEPQGRTGFSVSGVVRSFITRA
ncbi:hypothetical protein, partial [Nostoc sp.]|uniref:hypothetical protein n=1 Tax=Nostoc sp. TaxID=1180 RepID=UPI002FFCAEE7